MPFGDMNTPNTSKNPALSSAIAGGVIAVSLLDKLLAKDVLTLDEARDVLDTALRAVSPYAQAGEVNFDAAQIIMGLLSGKYSAHTRAP
jgi:hypothetical protein